MPRADRCRCCGSTQRHPVLVLTGVPVENSRLYSSPSDAAAVARGDLEIESCGRCGFVQNSAFDPSIVVYDDQYEASQGFSPYFLAYAERIADELIERFDLRGGHALEIGCGGGDFLRLFVERCGGSGVGLDPTLPAPVEEPDLSLRPEWYGVGAGDFGADLVMIRHTLEHIPDVAEFLTTVRTEMAGRPESVLYIEVPDTRRIAAEGAFWDIYYEHCSYFDAESLSELLRRTGFDPVEVRLEYEGQYLIAYARLGEIRGEVVPHSSPMSFDSLVSNTAEWQAWVDERIAAGERVAIWAASSKAVALLSSVERFDPIVAVDINPAKAGQFLPATATPVCHPDDLAAFAPDAVLIMNPIYATEIGSTLAELDLAPTLWGMGPVPQRIATA